MARPRRPRQGNGGDVTGETATDGRPVDDAGPTGRTHNITAMVDELRPMIEEMDRLREERTGINQALGEIRAAIRAKGLNMHAVRHALQYRDLAEDQREGYDITADIARRACGVPVQLDLDLAAAAATEPAP